MEHRGEVTEEKQQRSVVGVRTAGLRVDRREQRHCKKISQGRGGETMRIDERRGQGRGITKEGWRGKKKRGNQVDSGIADEQTVNKKCDVSRLGKGEVTVPSSEDSRRPEKGKGGGGTQYMRSRAVCKLRKCGSRSTW